MSALDIKTTLRPTEIYPGERTTLTYPMTIPCQGDIDVELEYFLGLVTHDKAKVTVENSPHFYDLQMVDYTIDYKDSKTIDAVFYVKNNDTRLWQDPSGRILSPLSCSQVWKEQIRFVVHRMMPYHRGRLSS